MEETEITEETKTQRELREERNAKLTKGHNVIGMRKTTVGQLQEELGEAASDQVVFTIVIGVNEHCRSDGDIRAVMKENQIMGTIYPMRNMNPVTQKEKSVTMFE